MPDHLGSDQRKVKPDDGEEKEIQGKFVMLVELIWFTVPYIQRWTKEILHY